MLWCFDGGAQRFFAKFLLAPALVPALLDLFPDARFIHVIRDARMAANSLLKIYRVHRAQDLQVRGRRARAHPVVLYPRVPCLAEYARRYGLDDIRTPARLWNDVVATLDALEPALPACLTVRYEDILARPTESVAMLLEFCQLPPPDPGNRAFAQKVGEIGRVRHANAYAHFETITDICRDNLKRHGYDA